MTRPQRQLRGHALVEQIRDRLRKDGAYARMPQLKIYWAPSRETGAVCYRKQGPHQVEINLRALERWKKDEREFLLEVLLQLLRSTLAGPVWASTSPPGSYAEGLAQLELLCRLEREERVPFYMPHGTEMLVQGRGFWCSPAEFVCAASALGRMAEECGVCLPREKAERLRRQEETLRLLCRMPEIGYYGSDLPESSAARGVRNARLLLARNPERYGAVPFLHALFRPSGEERPPEEVLERYRSVHDPVYDGIVLRMLAAGTEAFSGALRREPALLERLAEQTGRYWEDGIALLEACCGLQGGLLREDMEAVGAVLLRLNRAVDRYHIPIRSGTIHPMDGP